jgi:hypothetical protein
MVTSCSARLTQSLEQTAPALGYVIALCLQIATRAKRSTGARRSGARAAGRADPQRSSLPCAGHRGGLIRDLAGTTVIRAGESRRVAPPLGMGIAISHCLNGRRDACCLSVGQRPACQVGRSGKLVRRIRTRFAARSVGIYAFVASRFLFRQFKGFFPSRPRFSSRMCVVYGPDCTPDSAGNIQFIRPGRGGAIFAFAPVV